MRIGLPKTAAAALLLLAPTLARGADAPFAYNGRLMDEKGHVLSELNHTVVFRIYDQASGGSPLWACTNNVVLTADGQFSVELTGRTVAGTTLGELFASNAGGALYIGLTVDNDSGEISPRQKLMAAPWAVCAADSVAAKGNMAVTGACTGSKLSVGGAAVANKATTAGAFKCSSLVAGSMTVTNNCNLAVKGTVSGKGVIPIGGILIWSGTTANIPGGWVLCNGQTANGRKTPDLRDRFIVGAGPNSYKVGATGGEATHKLTLKELPSHSHSYTFTGADIALAYKKNNFFYCQAEKYDLSNPADTDATGGNQAHENRPPYYALCYIMRVK